MEKESKTLIIFFVFLVVISVSISFYKYTYLEDIDFFTDENSVPSGQDSIKDLLKI